MLSTLSLLSLCFIGQIPDVSRPLDVPSISVPSVLPTTPSQPDKLETKLDSDWRGPSDVGEIRREVAAKNADAPDTVSRGGKSPAVQHAEDTLRQMLAGIPKTNQAGELVTLLAAVSASNDPRQQQLIINAYWRLVEVAIVRQIRQDSLALLQDLSPRAENAPLLQSALAATAAKEKDAEVAMTAMQCEFAALLDRPSDAPLPLPTDMPHVGDYHTRFAESFRGRLAPAIAVQLDRTLPLYRDAIDRRLAAFEECDKALQAAISGWQTKQDSLADLLAAARESSRQREAFLSIVMRYNFGIADYAYATSAPMARPEAIVSMLIKPPYDLNLPTPTNNVVADPGVRPAGFNDVLPNTLPPNAMQPGTGLPGAVMPGGRLGGSRTPTPADPNTRPQLQGDLPLGLRTSRTSLPPQQPVTAPSFDRMPVRVRKPILKEVPAANAGDPFRSSQSASAVHPIAPGKEPAIALPLSSPEKNASIPAATARPMADMTNPAAWIDAAGSPLTLAASLAATRGDRRALVDVYWQASRRASEYTLLLEHANRIQSLRQFDGGSAYQQQRLQASILTASAAASEWKAVWTETQGRLAAQLGRENDAIWPVPATPMLRGPINLPASLDARSNADFWQLKRMTAVVSKLELAVAMHDRALEEALAAREQAFSAAKSGAFSVALQSAASETEEALATLDDVTARNLAVADLVFALLPPEASSDLIAATLVPQP